MNIETKFDIGQEVYYLESTTNIIHHGKVVDIKKSTVDDNIPFFIIDIKIMTTGAYPWELFATQEEAEQKLIDKLQDERDFERRDKTYIVKQLNDPNDYVIREDYIKLEQRNKQLEEQLEEKDKEIEKLAIMIKTLPNHDTEIEQLIRKQVCSEIREKLEMDEYNTCENTAWCVYLDYLKEILDQIEQSRGEKDE